MYPTTTALTTLNKVKTPYSLGIPKCVTEEGFDEKTWHRIILAEYLRRSQEEILSSSHPDQYHFSERILTYCQLFQTAAVEKAQRYAHPKNMSNQSMFVDHRIRDDPDQQYHLLHFLYNAIESDVEQDVTNVTNGEPFTDKLLDACRNIELEWLAREFGTAEAPS